MVKVLIFGASGFIGKHIKQGLSEYKLICPSSKDVDLTKYKQVYKFISKINPDVIIHAAYSASVDNEYYYNTLLNINLLEAAKLIGISKVIALSSLSAFPSKISVLSESVFNNGALSQSKIDYAASKKIIDDYIQCAIVEPIKTQFHCLFLPSIYGSLHNSNLYNPIYNLIQALVACKYYKKPFIHYNNGNELRNYLYVQDLIKVIIRLINYNFSESRIIVSNSEPVKTKDLILFLAKTLNFKESIIFAKQKPIIPIKICNTEVLKKIYPFKLTSIKTGLKKSISSYIKICHEQLFIKK